MQFMQVYSRMEQTREGTDKKMHKYFEENSKPKHSKSTFFMKKRASDRTFHELRPGN